MEKLIILFLIMNMGIIRTTEKKIRWPDRTKLPSSPASSEEENSIETKITVIPVRIWSAHNKNDYSTPHIITPHKGQYPTVGELYTAIKDHFKCGKNSVITIKRKNRPLAHSYTIDVNAIGYIDVKCYHTKMPSHVYHKG